MRHIPLLLTLTVLCVTVPCAHAWTDPRDDAARLTYFLPIARAAWPASPCAGRETVHVGADEQLAAEALAITGNPNQAINGMAAPPTCEAWVSSGLSPHTFCTVLVHEFGHLAGREHTDAPGDVMNAEGDLTYAPCERAIAPSPSAALKEELRSVLPAPRAAWRISCRERGDTMRRCVARRGTRVRRYDVTQSPGAVTIADAD